MIRRNDWCVLFYGLIAVLAVIYIGTRPRVAQADVRPSTHAGGQAAAFLLDEYPDALAAYSFHQLRSGYTGPAVRVRRGSDDAEQDFGFATDGTLDVQAIESWLGTADGYVVRWYSQVSGEPDLVQTTSSRQPYIAIGGAVTTDSEGRPAVQFDASRETYLTVESGLSSSIPLHNMMSVVVGERIDSSRRENILNFESPGNWGLHTLTLRTQSGGGFITRSGFAGNIYGGFTSAPSAWILNTDGMDLKTFNNHARTNTEALSGTLSRSYYTLGIGTKNLDRPLDGHIAAFVVFPGQATDDGVQDRYDILNATYELGPDDYNRDAVLPQEKDWQVALYNWLETIDVQDVTLPAGTFSWDGGLSDVDDVADLWMQLAGASASRVVRAEPEWYVLDAGNGKGIEATGSVRIWHQPESGHGNPPRSWSNEPAFLYQLSVPNGDGSEGNPYYQMRALGLRALVVAAADMMMYAEENGYAYWTDMHGKALLGWAETYRWAKNELPSEVAAAFEEAFAMYLNRIIANGARAVNTNMDMFPMHAAAEIYMAAEDPTLKSKALQAVKRTLLGHTDGELGVKHDVFAAAGWDYGVFAPAGYIMEGDQPDIFYMGESLYHLTGALAAVTDRETGTTDPDWAFLEEVVRRMEEWYMYQAFYDPGVNAPGQGGLNERHHYHGPGGFAGRTGAGFPSGQADFIWRDLTAADWFEESRPRLYRLKGGHLSRGDAQRKLPSRRGMENAISSKLSGLTSALSSPYEGEPPQWNGWSPWTKPTPYLPPKGWYSRLSALVSGGPDDTVYLPISRSNHYYNKGFGGYPTGDEYWAYKQNDGTRDWGFYVEAQARQGGYGGWYGGKLEAFWTETTGVVILNRHGKTGCDGNNEDSSCWNNLEYRAGHHVWGRDESDKGFTTLLLRGRELQRTSTFDLEGATPTVEVANVFNDPSLSTTTSQTGEQTGSEIEGEFEVANTFAAQPDGLQITHTLTSDEADEVAELWASIPVFLRAVSLDEPGDQPQRDYDDTSIEYWTGSTWRPMPEDADGDGTPELVATTALRLGRDYEFGDGPQYVYVAIEGIARVRLASRAYEDPYQTKTRVRTVHIDLHGDPGTTKPLPAEKRVTYTVQTTDPTGGGYEEGAQYIGLQQGWNLVSSAVSPEAAGMEAVFADIQSDVDLVRNESGAVYDPDDGRNEIGSWDAARAYAVFAKSFIVLSMEGVDVDPSSTAIPLRRGWNWVPYLLKRPMAVAEALASIEESLRLVKDEDGRVYYPQEDIDSLGDLQPGKGYKVYVNQDATLTYPGGN